MPNVTLELNIDKQRKGYTIPKGTRFTVDEYVWNQCRQFKRLITVTYNNKEEKISPLYLNKVTTPLEFATQEEYVILECIIPNVYIEQGSLHKVKKSSWEGTNPSLTLSENVKEKGEYNKFRFIIHQPKQDQASKPIEDKIITIKCINNKGYTGRLTLNKIYQIYQSEWDKHHEYIISKHNSKEGVYQMLKSRFEIVSDEMKAKEPFYNMIQIKCINPFNVQPTIVIPREAIFTVDIKDWDDKLNNIGVNFWGKYYKVPKEHFRSIKAIHEEAGTFPSLPQGIRPKEYGKMVMFSTGGEEGAKQSNAWFDFGESIKSQEPRTPQWWGFDKSGELIYTDGKGNPISKEYVGREIANSDSVSFQSTKVNNSYKDFWDNEEARLNRITGINWSKASESLQSLEPTPVKDYADAFNKSITPEEYYRIAMGLDETSVNKPSLRTKPWQDQVLEMTQYYNSPILKELDGEALHKRIDEIKHGKQLVIDEVGISATMQGRTPAEKAMRFATNYGMLPIDAAKVWGGYPNRMLEQKAIYDIISQDSDHVITIHSPRQIGKSMWLTKLGMEKLFGKPKSLLTNITRSKKPKKKKQHIVEPMSNIKL